MNSLAAKFDRLSTDNAPGQERLEGTREIDHLLKGEPIPGRPVDFSHGDVNADAFPPLPDAFAAFAAGVALGGSQAYTEYRGHREIRELIAARLSIFTGTAVSAAHGVIITPGTQGALFLAIAAFAGANDKVAIIRPDYFANRKIVEFLGAEVVPVELNYLEADNKAGLDFSGLERAFEQGAKVLLFSNPNNPTGVIYSADELLQIAELAEKFQVAVVVDQLYSRMIYDGRVFSHYCALRKDPENVVTVLGPSKTESLSGYRLGVAFAASAVIERMERLQAIISLRAPGYSQAVLRTWFDEPAGWMAQRVQQHQAIRDEIVGVLRKVPGLRVRPTEAGSYLFPRLPQMKLSLSDFIKILKSQAGVTVTAGTEFSPTEAQSIRLNFSQNHKAAVAAVDRIATLIDRYTS